MKKTKYINFKAIGLSLIFLFNPNIAVIDVLPDFIGYIFLCIFLTNLADINETLSNALIGFKRLIFLDAAKIISILWIFGMSVTSERNSSLLLWSFAFGVLEMIFVIPAFLNLFKGLEELGNAHDNTSVVGYKRGRRSKKSYTEKMRRVTVAFVAVKAVFSFLPELADLTSTEYYENEGLLNLYRYIGIMRFLAFIPVLVLGIIWIIKCVAYFKRIDMDSVFCMALEKSYAEGVAVKKGIFVRRNITLAFVILITAFVFSFDFRLESINILPDFISGILLAVFFAVISKKTSVNKKTPIVLSVLYAILAFAAYLLEISFFDKYYYGAIYRSEEAMTAFVIMAVVSCASSALFAVLSCAVLKSLKKVIFEHTGVIALNSGYDSACEKMSDDIKKELGVYLKYCLAATVFYLLTDIGYVLYAKDFEYMFFINTVGAVIFIAAYVKAYIEISEAVKSRYILE